MFGILVRIMFLSMLFFVKNTTIYSCSKYAAGTTFQSSEVPSLYEQALDRLLDQETLDSTIQTLKQFHMMPCQSMPEIGKQMTRRHLIFIRSIMLRLFAQNNQPILSMSDNMGPVQQPPTQEKILIKKNLLISGKIDGTIKLTNIQTKSKIAFVKTGLGAFSSLAAKSGILATSNINKNSIQLWKINNLDFLGEIKPVLPTIHMQIVDNILIVLNSAACLDFYDLYTGKLICYLTTNIGKMVSDIFWDKNENTMTVTSNSGIYFISLGSLITLDRLIHNLRVDQIVLLSYIFHTRNAMFVTDQDLMDTFSSMPKEIQKVVRYFLAK